MREALLACAPAIRREAEENLRVASIDSNVTLAREIERLTDQRDAAINERDALAARIRTVLALCAEFKTACDNMRAVFKGTVADVAQIGEDGAA